MKLSCFYPSKAAAQGHGVGLWLTLTVAMILQIGPAFAGIYYDSTGGPATNNFYRIRSTNEVGDEILLYASCPVIPTNFVFEYFGANFSGNEQLRLRFYREGTNAAAMGELFYDSGWLGIGPAPTGATVRLVNFTAGAVVPLTNALPVDFTWTVHFQGVETNEQAGLLATVPLSQIFASSFIDLIICERVPCPPPQKDFDTYWWFALNGWNRMRAMNPYNEPVPINFRARIEGEIAGLHLLRPAPREGRMELTLIGESGRRYRIEGSPDLTQWSEVTTGLAVDRALSATVPADETCRFYRAVLLP